MFFDIFEPIGRALVLTLFVVNASLGDAQAQVPATGPEAGWTDVEIATSRTETPGWRDWPAAPQWQADPMNLFVVIETGDGHISLVDGDRFDVIHRFASHAELAGSPGFTPDGRYLFLASRDGWITKYDLWNLNVAAAVRAGIDTRGIAVSGDGRWIMAANAVPRTAVLFDTELKPVHTYPARTLDGRLSSRVSAVYDARSRKSFVVTLEDIPELWEISYDPEAPPIYDGLVHDYRMAEAIAKAGYHGVRRTPLEAPLHDLFFSRNHAYAMGTSRPPADGSPEGQVVNLDVRRKIATLPIAGLSRLGAGISFEWNGTRVQASPNLREGVVGVIDMKTWKRVKDIATPGPGVFLRSHDATPYAWVDSMTSSAADNVLTVIDKRTLETVASVKGPPGQTLAHVEFTQDGRYALASLRESDGTLIVYDAATFEEIKRLPMKKPAEKYNIFNSTAR